MCYEQITNHCQLTDSKYSVCVLWIRNEQIMLLDNNQLFKHRDSALNNISLSIFNYSVQKDNVSSVCDINLIRTQTHTLSNTSQGKLA